MTLAEAVEFLSAFVDNERMPSLGRRLTLEPVRRLLHTLGNPQDRLFIIHVAGTKGKGSVASMLEMILREAGYRTGLYTSPDLGGFAERFRVCGSPITPTAFAEGIAQIQKAVLSTELPGELHEKPSKFDVATALAFQYFESSKVDVAIIEVGMGGRSDSTNVCVPRVSVITSISYDHTKQLGSTLTSIATEKAGIIKAECPTISGVTVKEAQEVIESTCRARGSRLFQVEVDFWYHYSPGQVSRSMITPSKTGIVTRNRSWPVISLSLWGEHQAANAALAIATVERLQEMGLCITDEHVLKGFAHLRCPARIEIVRQRPCVVLDCAHNIASVEALVATLQEAFPDHFGARRIPTARRLLIFGSSRDKDLVGMMTILGAYFDHIYLTQYSRFARCASEAELLVARRASGVDVSTSFVKDAIDAWKLVENEASSDDLICITGSVFLAGEIRSFLSGRGGITPVAGGEEVV